LQAASPTGASPDWLERWKILNVVRGVLVMLGWLVVCFWPASDRLSDSLLQANDDILQPNTGTRRLETTRPDSANLWTTR